MSITIYLLAVFTHVHYAAMVSCVGAIILAIASRVAGTPDKYETREAQVMKEMSAADRASFQKTCWRAAFVFGFLSASLPPMGMLIEAKATQRALEADVAQQKTTAKP